MVAIVERVLSKQQWNRLWCIGSLPLSVRCSRRCDRRQLHGLLELRTVMSIVRLSERRFGVMGVTLTLINLSMLYGNVVVVLSLALLATANNGR